MTAAGYWTMTSFSSLGVRYLPSKRPFSSDDLIKVCRELGRQRIWYLVDEQRRVEVAADQLDEAAEAVAKLDLGQRPIDEIRSDSSGRSLWDGPSEREQQDQLIREKVLEGLIGRQKGVAWSYVSLHRPHSWPFRRSESKASAFVYIETERGRPLPSETVQSIPLILTGYEPELAPSSITVMDTRGNHYFDSGNPALGDSSRHRAREEEITQEILEKLDWINGVRVQVQVVSEQPAERITVPAEASVNARPSGMADHVMPGQAGGGPHLSRSDGSPPFFVPNQPAQLEPERGSPPKPAPPAGAASIAAETSTAKPQALSKSNERQEEHGRVLVHVPRSFYFNAEIRTNDREPAREDLRLMVERTEKTIRDAVGLVVPNSESWKIDVDTFPDEGSLNRQAVLPSSTDSRRKFLDWGIVGATLAVVSILAAAGSWIQVVRRPGRQPELAAQTRRYHLDSASEPGPSERVRELIRRSPEAAASVLQRWTGQGGHVS